MYALRCYEVFGPRVPPPISTVFRSIVFAFLFALQLSVSYVGSSRSALRVKGFGDFVAVHLVCHVPLG